MRKAILIISALITLIIAINFGRLAIQYWDEEPIRDQRQSPQVTTTELVPS